MDIQYIGNDTYACVYDGIIFIDKDSYEDRINGFRYMGREKVKNGRRELIKRISNIIDFNK